MTGRRAAGSVGIALTMLLGVMATPALGCTCGRSPDARDALGGAHAAVVGTPIDRREVSPGQWPDSPTYEYTLRVERAFKRRLGDTIRIRAGGNSSLCGLSLPLNRRVGLLLGRGPQPYEVGLCNQIAPRELLAAARPLPRPAGRGRLALLAGGRFSTARAIGFSRRGGVLAYGLGGGTTSSVSVCPGAGTAVEVTSFARPRSTRDETYVMTRRLRDFRVVRAQRVANASDASCLDPAGSDVLVVVSSVDEEPGRLLRLRGGRRTTIASLRGDDVVSHAGVAFVSTRAGVIALEAATEARYTVTRRARALDEMAVSPDGTALAGISFTGEAAERLEIVDLGSGAVRRVALGESNGGLPVWVDSRRVAVVEGGRPGSVRLYRRTGARIGRSRAPRLHQALERMTQPNLRALVPVPGEPLVRASRRRPPPFAGASAACRLR